MSQEAETIEALLSGFAARFVNRLRPYAVQQEDGTYRWRYEDLTPEVLMAHLRGETTLALSSSDEVGRCRWLCLDLDGADGLKHLLGLNKALALHGLPGLVEASRRGGHLWFFLDVPTPVAEARVMVVAALETLGVSFPDGELYPDTGASAVGVLGHAVRLPLGTHRLTGRRYALFDEYSLPCVFTSSEAALRFLLERPTFNVAAPHLAPVAGSVVRAPEAPQLPRAAENIAMVDAGVPAARGRTGTHSPVIRWVDAQVSPLALLEDLAPETELRRTGRGYLGWCPFHDDRAPDEAGRPGTPSFYVVQDRRYGWSWRCLSSNCPQSWGPMRHTFELYQRLLDLSVGAAIVEACQRWPDADARAASARGMARTALPQENQESIDD
jgi:hypothetical protein